MMGPPANFFMPDLEAPRRVGSGGGSACQAPEAAVPGHIHAHGSRFEAAGALDVVADDDVRDSRKRP